MKFRFFLQWLCTFLVSPIRIELSRWDETFPISWTLSTRNSSLFINGDICANGKKTSSHIHKRTTLYCGRTLGKVIFRCFFLYLTTTVFFLLSLVFIYRKHLCNTTAYTARPTNRIGKWSKRQKLSLLQWKFGHNP